MIGVLGIILVISIGTILLLRHSTKYLVAGLVGALILSLELIAVGFGKSLRGPWYTLLTMAASFDILLSGTKGFSKIKALSSEAGMAIAILLICSMIALWLVFAGLSAAGALGGG